MKKYIAEFIGTFWLVLGGCGSAVFAAGIPELGIGYLGVSLAFGLTVLTMAYAIGHISGCHLNPAVSIGLFIGKRFNGKDLIPYIVSQIAGAITAAALLYFLLSGQDGFTGVGGFAANGFGAHSPHGFSMGAAFVAEFILTAVFLFVIMGTTHSKAPSGFAGLAIGLCLTLIHLISIPITNTSVNPARSLSQAIFAEGGWAMGQVWLFFVAPILGAIAGAVIYNIVSPEKD